MLVVVLCSRVLCSLVQKSLFIVSVAAAFNFLLDGFHSQTNFERLKVAHKWKRFRENKQIPHNKILAYCGIKPTSDEVEFYDSRLAGLGLKLVIIYP